MLIDSILQNDYKELTKKLQKEYDIPNLVLEKEKLIESLNNDKIKTYWILGFLFLTTISLGCFAVHQYQIKKQYRSRFEKIIKETSINDNSEISKENLVKISAFKIEDIAQELINQILKKLNHFENERGYLKSNITVQMLSTIFETNSKYVFKIVNVYKGKSFTQYINDLRIDYAIVQLKEDNKLRKFTIQALALEFGFNNAESFSAAFYKKTGIKPAYFIKELDNVI